VTALHASIYTMSLLLTGGLTIWALFFIATGRVVDGAFRSTYVLMIGVAVAQALTGVVMVLDDLRPAQSWHYLYGVSLIVFMGAGYVFATRSDQRREGLILGFTSAAAFGLILRAVATAHS
jgi:heme A synthase